MWPLERRAGLWPGRLIQTLPKDLTGPGQPLPASPLGWRDRVSAEGPPLSPTGQLWVGEAPISACPER